MSHRAKRRNTRGLIILCVVCAGCMLPAASAQAALPTLTLTVTASSITVGGATQSGGVNIVTTVTGVKEGGAVLFLLKPGVSIAEVESFMSKKGAAKDPNNTIKYGSLVFDVEGRPGKAVEAQAELAPGEYLALGPNEGKGPKPHTFFAVTPAASPTALPAPEATERSIDFGFRGPKVLHDGELVRFENEGFVVHMDIAFPAKSKGDAFEVDHDLLVGHERGLEKLAAGEPVGFAGPLSHEAFQQETITAKPGWYVQACFMETQDGRDHTRLGMERVIRIVK